MEDDPLVPPLGMIATADIANNAQIKETEGGPALAIAASQLRQAHSSLESTVAFYRQDPTMGLASLEDADQKFRASFQAFNAQIGNVRASLSNSRAVRGSMRADLRGVASGMIHRLTEAAGTIAERLQHSVAEIIGRESSAQHSHDPAQSRSDARSRDGRPTQSPSRTSPPPSRGKQIDR